VGKTFIVFNGILKGALEALCLPKEGSEGLGLRIAEKVVEMFNLFEEYDSYSTYKMGFETRSRSRLSEPSLRPSRESFILGATAKNMTTLLGVVEILLERPTGKLAPAIQVFPRPGRPTAQDQPYLCNLCVKNYYRRRGLGKTLIALSEQLVLKHWQRDRMYLHVINSNADAQRLYEAMGYDKTRGMNRIEAKIKGMQNLSYYTKKLLADDWGSLM